MQLGPQWLLPLLCAIHGTKSQQVQKQSIDPDNVKVSFLAGDAESTVKLVHLNEEFTLGATWSWTAVAEEFVALDTVQELVVDFSLDGAKIGRVNIPIDPLESLPTSAQLPVAAGMTTSGLHNALVSVSLNNNTLGSASADVRALPAVASLLPLLVVVVLAAVTRKVELALFMGIFSGALLVSGSIRIAFQDTLSEFIVRGIVPEDGDTAYMTIVMFTLFLGGLIGMIDRSGGVQGMTKALRRYASSARSVQVVTFCAGLLLFFDDYTNALVVGTTMRPVSDAMMVSREKLSFIVDATSAPIAALFPVSSWIGFEAGVVNKQLEIIQKLAREDNVTLPLEMQNGFSVLIAATPWKFYSLLMIVFQVALLASQRDFGPMLVAERKARVYRRTDGGDGGMQGAQHDLQGSNTPPEGQPAKAYNFALPIAVLVFLIVFIMVRTGLDSTGGWDAGLAGVLGDANVYAALLWGTMGASFVTMVFYALQFKQNGYVQLPTVQALKAMVWRETPKQERDDAVRPLMSAGESVDAFLRGLVQIFPATIVLVLAWAMGSVMGAVGADRYFSGAVQGGNVQGSLPALSFLISVFMALCTGTSFGTMSIMYPLALVPAYQISVNLDDDFAVFYGTVGSILSGAVCGDHCSYISDTTVLSAIGTQTDLAKHVVTQLPYAMTVAFWSLLLGYLPAGMGAYSAPVGLALSSLATVLTVFLIGVPALHPEGKYDRVQELIYQVFYKRKNDELRSATISFVAGQSVSSMERPETEDAKPQVSPEDDQL